MVTIRYHEPGLARCQVDRALDPDGSGERVLHHAQEIFEGLKAYRTAGGGAALFVRSRMPGASSTRRAGSPCRSCEDPQFPSRPSTSGRRSTGRGSPEGDGSHYIRPFMFANEIFLGVKPSSDYLFIVIASSVGAYFKTDAPAVSVWCSVHPRERQRHRRGQVRRRYAASLQAQAEATRHGCDQVVSSMPSNGAGSRSWAA